MNRQLFSLLLLIIVTVLLPCCAPAFKPLPELTPPDWQDGETAVYEIVRNDSVLYTRKTVVQFDEEGTEPTVVITNIVQGQTAPFYFFDSTTFALTRYTLTPLWSYRLVSTEISITEVEADFEPERIELRKTTVDGSERKDFKNTQNTYGIEMLQHLFRAVPLDPGLHFQLNIIIPLEFRTSRINVTVLGTKMVSTPLGDILCREVSAVAQRRQLRLLYELAQPHRLVAIRDVENGTETRLVGFSISATDTLPTLP
ncbi:hypothetical protein HPY86_03625 [candidate division WOR-3 bacterium]|nr:hypothetical protein [candidate division WOR-3 bacterium]